MSFKETVKHYAYELGADLIGFGGIDRCKHAPMMMSPQGLFPGAKTVIVMGIHHPDACIELGGETHPQEVGPYSVQYLMNARLDEMSYRMGSFLEQQGYGAVPIVSSNIWRYNQYKELKAVFAPDVSHIYMSVVAGDIPLVLVAQRLITSIDSSTLMAVPLFILAGELMNTGGITRRIIRFSNVLVRHIKGGLSHVTVVTSMVFASY